MVEILKYNDRAQAAVLGLPLSCIGLPVCCVPVWLPAKVLPIGVQLIAAPWHEDRVMRAAPAFESAGVVRSPIAALSEGSP